MRTWLTERFGLSVPVVAAPRAGVSTGRLAAAVSAAGGLGMIGAGPTSTQDRLREQCADARGAGRFGVGLMAWPLAQDDSLVDVVAAEAPALVSLSFGPYERWIEPLRAAGIVVATQVGTLDEARAAERAGVDVLVARGGEGGAHGPAAVATLPLLQSVLDAVQVPVLAAGGIATARGLAAGSAGAWVGTAFLACTEAATSPGTRQRLLAAKDTDTAYGRVFDVGQRIAWPLEYGGRALRNAYFDRWTGREDELARNDAASASCWPLGRTATSTSRASTPVRASVSCGKNEPRPSPARVRPSHGAPRPRGGPGPPRSAGSCVRMEAVPAPRLRAPLPQGTVRWFDPTGAWGSWRRRTAARTCSCTPPRA